MKSAQYLTTSVKTPVESTSLLRKQPSTASRLVFPQPSTYTFALTKGSIANPSELHAIDSATGDQIGQGVRVLNPAGQIVPVVTGITLSAGTVINGVYNYDHYYVSLGDNTTTFPNDPTMSNHIWSIHVDYVGGVQQVVLSQLVMSTNGVTLTDLCWSDFSYNGIGIGPVALIEGRQDEMIYFDTYNNLSPTTMSIVHSFAPNERLEGLSWMYNNVDPLCSPFSSTVYNARLYLSTYVPGAGGTDHVNIYELEFDASGGIPFVEAKLVDFIDPSFVSGPDHGIGWVTGHSNLFVGMDPASTVLPPGGVKFHNGTNYCTPPQIQGANLHFPSSIISQPIEDFMTILEWDPYQL
ncbi:MAG: hypothetical protein AAGJ93_13665 [Bacteroidota bacterium]